MAAQIDSASIGTVTKTCSGVFADLITAAPPPAQGPGKRSGVLAGLVAQHAVGDAMLHLTDERVVCLEICLDTDDDWQHIASARLI